MKHYRYRNRNWLYGKYWNKGLNLQQIGNLCGTSRQLIHQWMQKFDITRRTRSEAAGNDGRSYDNGYVVMRKPKHPNSNSQGSIREHRFVMSEYLGRALKPNEHIHRINGKRDDNRIENLYLTTKTNHKLSYGDAYRDGYEKGFATAFLLFATINKKEN